MLVFFYAIEDFKETYMDALKPFSSKSLSQPYIGYNSEQNQRKTSLCAALRCETIY